MNDAIQEEKKLNTIDANLTTHQLERQLTIAVDALLEIARMNADSATSGEMKATARMAIKFLKSQEG